MAGGKLGANRGYEGGRVEHQDEADRLEREAERLEQEGERVGGEIDETRRDWEQKEQDASVPGAQPDPDEETDDVTGAETDPSRVSEEGGP